MHFNQICAFTWCLDWTIYFVFISAIWKNTQNEITMLPFSVASVLPPWCLQWCLTLITGKTSSDKATAIQSRVLFFAIKKYPTVLTQWQDLNFIALSLLCTSSRSLCVCHQHATCSSIFCPYHPTSFIFQLHCDFKGGVKILLSLFRIYPLKKQFVM